MAYDEQRRVKKSNKYLLKLGVLVKVITKVLAKHIKIYKYSEPNFQRNSVIWW